MKTAITHSEWIGLQTGRISTIHSGRVSLSVTGKEQEKRFVMKGPSGIHSLLVEATDLDRLNAHWLPFLKHGLN